MAVRLRADGGRIRIDLEFEHLRQRGDWQLVVLHDRQIVARATLTATRTTDALQLRRSVTDWYGVDTIVTRASGPGGEQCRATAAL
jgi:hypothetical protein